MKTAEKTPKASQKAENVTITAPKIHTAEFKIIGTAPYIQLRFSEKAMNAMREKMELGSQAAKKKARDARNFDEDFEQAKHISDEGWPGIPASAFRNAMISACRLVGFKMTLAKLSVFVFAYTCHQNAFATLHNELKNPTPLRANLVIGMSISRYLPAKGTAGFARILVSGNSRVPRPPPRINEIT